MIAVPARFEAGFEGETLAFAGEILELCLPRAFAPGAPVRFDLALPEIGEPLALAGRTIGSKRREDGRFHVRVRLTNLRREARLSLEALAAEAPGA